MCPFSKLKQNNCMTCTTLLTFRSAHTILYVGGMCAGIYKKGRILSYRNNSCWLNLAKNSALYCLEIRVTLHMEPKGTVYYYLLSACVKHVQIVMPFVTKNVPSSTGWSHNYYELITKHKKVLYDQVIVHYNGGLWIKCYWNKTDPNWLEGQMHASTLPSNDLRHYPYITDWKKM